MSDDDSTSFHWVSDDSGFDMQNMQVGETHSIVDESGRSVLITRQEGSVQKHYVHIGTGNFNEKTAKIYTDISLLTYNQEIAEDVKNVFDFLFFNYKRFEFNHLLVSPYSNRSGITERISREIANALSGKPASIMIKCNNLVDEDIVSLLYDASQAGVKIRLIIRV